MSALLPSLGPRRWVLGILVVAALVRLWGVAHDLPYIYHPDEPVPVRLAYRMLRTGGLNPYFFHWPSFVIYVNLAVQGVHYAFLHLLGRASSPADVSPLVEVAMGVTYARSPAIVLAARLVSVSFGVGTVLLTYLAGTTLTDRPAIGLLAGSMAALSPLNVGLDRLITPDTYACFFVAAVLAASIQVWRRGTLWSYVLAGLSLGLAASSKYNGGLVVLTFLSAHIMRCGWRGYRDHGLYVAIVAAGVGFLVATPYALLDMPAFYEGLRWNSEHYSTGHPGMQGHTLQWYAHYLWTEFGPLCVLALMGAVVAARSHRRERLLLWLFPASYFLFIIRFVVRNDRTLLPLTPFLFVLAACALVDLLDRGSSVASAWGRRCAVAACVLLALSVPAFLGARMAIATIDLTTPDSRETARIWIPENLPAGSKVAVEAYSPFVVPGPFNVDGIGQITLHTTDWYVANGFNYLVFSQGMYGRFYEDPQQYSAEIAQYDEFFHRFPLVRQFNDGDYEVRIYRVAERRFD